MTATCRILSTANVSALSHAHFNNNVLSIHSNGAIATGTSFMDTRSCLYGFKTRCHWLPRNLLCKIYQPTPPPTEIWPVSRSQCGTEKKKINRPWSKSNQFWRWSRYISMQKFSPLLPCVLKKMPRNLELTSQNGAKTKKSTDHDLIGSEGGQDAISRQNFRPFLPCVLRKMPRNPKFDPFH